MVSTAHWQNAIDCTLGASPNGFIDDLAKKVSNSGESEAGARWLLSFVSDFLKGRELPHAPLDPFDFIVYDLERLDALWHGFRMLADSLPSNPLPEVAEFLVRRLPHVWERPPAINHEPTTAAVSIADRADDIISLFSAGCAPTGSGDKYALRRKANQLLAYVVRGYIGNPQPVKPAGGGSHNANPWS